MAPEKAPAFQFYPKDWDTDVNVIPMTYEEEGVYWAILRLVWLNVTVTANLDELRQLLKGRPSLKQMERWWKRVGRCFEVRDGLLVHKRIDKERKAQADSRERRADAARKRWEKEQSTSNVDAMQMHGSDAKLCSPSASATASPSASPTAVSDGPLVSGQASPKGWGKVHSGHVVGFCDWLCLPDFVFEEFRTKSPGPEYVKGWAAKVRETWEGQTIGDDNLKFWRLRWSESHRTAEIKKPFSVADALARKAGNQ